MGISKGYVLDDWSYPIVLLNLRVKANILIDQTRHARLADFGLLTIMSDPTNLSSSSSCAQGGTARWMSPELIDPQKFGYENSHPTKSSDCYTLGMVIYETISGHRPFNKHADLTVFVKVLGSKRPPREAGFAGSSREILKWCWTPQPSARPNVEEVLEYLEMASQSSKSPPRAIRGVDRDAGSSSGMYAHFIPPLGRFVISVRSIYLRHPASPCDHNQCAANSQIPPIDQSSRISGPSSHGIRPMVYFPATTSPSRVQVRLT